MGFVSFSGDQGTGCERNAENRVGFWCCRTAC